MIERGLLLTKNVPITLVSQEIPRVLGAVTGTGDKDQIDISHYTAQLSYLKPKSVSLFLRYTSKMIFFNVLFESPYKETPWHSSYNEIPIHTYLALRAPLSGLQRKLRRNITWLCSQYHSPSTEPYVLLRPETLAGRHSEVTLVILASISEISTQEALNKCLLPTGMFQNLGYDMNLQEMYP